MSRAPTPVQLILLMCGVEVLSMVGAVTFPALLPTFIDVWNLSKTDAGWINGIYYAGYLTAVPMLMSLTDRMSPRRIYLACLVVSALASLGFATLTDGFWTAMLFRALGGVGLAGSYMPGLKLLTDHLEHARPHQDHSRAVAFYTSSFGIGTSLSFFMAGEIAGRWDWQTAFAVTVAGP
ncbi:MAG: MFS transporter, partial [bacterium]